MFRWLITQGSKEAGQVSKQTMGGTYSGEPTFPYCTPIYILIYLWAPFPLHLSDSAFLLLPHFYLLPRAPFFFSHLLLFSARFHFTVVILSSPSHLPPVWSFLRTRSVYYIHLGYAYLMTDHNWIYSR